jgi:Repeat of unknown function (DUF5648)
MMKTMSRCSIDSMRGRCLVRRPRVLGKWVLIICCLTFAAAGLVEAQTIDQDLAKCPTPAEVATVNAELALSFETDPSAPALVCHASQGSVDLTLMKRRAYRTLLAMKRAVFDAKLPWADTRSVWTWLVNESGVTGIRFRSDIATSSCCSPANTINVLVTANSYLALTDLWNQNNIAGGLGDVMALIVHEARHNQGLPHTCGTNDQTLEEMGAWGAQTSFWQWIAAHSDHNYLQPNSPTIPASYYREEARDRAEDIRFSRFCQNVKTFATLTAIEFYNTVLNHYFMTASAAEAAAIDAGSAGAGWVHTGKTFNVFPDEADAPLNALPVCRFYGNPAPGPNGLRLGPNSHFYTIDPEECDAVKQDPGWIYEGVAFWAIKPNSLTGLCAQYGGDNTRIPPGRSSSQRVWRNYNGRFAFNDSNHRYSTEVAVYDQMTLAGWSREGVTICAAQ